MLVNLSYLQTDNSVVPAHIAHNVMTFFQVVRHFFCHLHGIPGVVRTTAPGPVGRSTFLRHIEV